MINVNVDPLKWSIFNAKGYWFHFEDGTLTTFRNAEGKALFELVYDQTEHQNIVLTRNSVYYTNRVNISANELGDPILNFNIFENNEIIPKVVKINSLGEQSET